MKNILFGFFILQLVGVNLSALTLGVVPQQSPLQLIKVWKPVAEYLEKETGEKITLEIERSIPEFENKLYGGFYDIAYMNPYHYVVANQKQGYLAKARSNNDIVGILVVNKASNISDVSMIRDKEFLFPAPDAFAATLLIKYELLSQYAIKIDANNSRYVNSHDSVYKGVYRGIGGAGGGIERTFKSLDDKEAKNALVILHKTKAYPSHPFAYKPSVSQAVQNKVTKALLHMPQDLLDSLSMNKIILTENAEYEGVKDLSQKIFLDKQ